MINIRVKDFQSLDNVDIQVEGLTVIVGESSSGKTAIFRAIQAAVSNRFRSSHVQHGKSYTYVLINYGGDKTLKVRRGLYGSPDMILGDLQFNKLNRSVPQEVLDFNNFGTISVGADEYSLNLHPQFSKPLLLSFSQRKVMELLSSSKGIDDFNKANKALSERRLTNKGAFDTVSDILANDRNKLSIVEAKLSSIEPVFERLSVVYSAFKNQDEALGILHSIETLSSSCSLKSSLLSKYSLLLNLLGKVSSINELLSNIDLSLSVLSSIGSTVTKIYLKKKQLSLLNDDSYSALDTISSILSLLQGNSSKESKLKSLNQSLQLYDRASKLSELQSHITYNLSVINNIEGLLSISRRLNETLLNKKQNVCPMCGNKITDPSMKAKIQQEVDALSQELAVNKSKIEDLCSKINLPYDKDLVKNLTALKKKLETNLNKIEEEFLKIQSEIDSLNAQDRTNLPEA